MVNRRPIPGIPVNRRHIPGVPVNRRPIPGVPVNRRPIPGVPVNRRSKPTTLRRQIKIVFDGYSQFNSFPFRAVVRTTWRTLQ